MVNWYEVSQRRESYTEYLKSYLASVFSSFYLKTTFNSLHIKTYASNTNQDPPEFPQGLMRIIQ